MYTQTNCPKLSQTEYSVSEQWKGWRFNLVYKTGTVNTESEQNDLRPLTGEWQEAVYPTQQQRTYSQ